MSVTIAQLIAPLAAGASLHGAYVLQAYDEGTATITIGKGEDRLAVQLRARDPSRPCYQSTRSLNVSYVGRTGGVLDRDAEAALRVLLEVLARNDRGEPLPISMRGLPIAAKPDGRAEVRVENGTGYVRIDATCEMSCVFCTRGEGGSLPKPRPLSLRSDVERDIDRLVEQGARRMIIGGDEPLAHPDIEALIARTRRGSVTAVHLVTSGQRLVDRALLERLVRAGVTKVELPLYGATAEVHDGITKLPGSFEGLRSAVRALREAGVELDVHTILLRQNLAQVAQMRRFVREELGLRHISFGHLMPRSDAVEDYRAKMPTYAEVRRALAGTETPLFMFPVCVTALTGAPVNPNLPPPPPIDGSARVRPASRCASCTRAAGCPGTFEIHLRAYGEQELEPFA